VFSWEQAYDGIRGEMMETAKNHHKIASNIRELVILPFGRWCDEHAARVQNSHEDLQVLIKDHAKQADLAKKLRSQYFNKCRLVEDLEEENKLAFQSPETSSPKVKQTPKIVLPDEQEAESEPEPVELGDKIYAHDELKKLLAHMLDTIKIREAKVPILGTYQNTSTGMDIVEYVQKNLNASSVSYAERVGQDLVNNGFLRLVGNMGNIFANSSRMNYQWRSKAFIVAGLPEKKKPLIRVSSVSTSEDSSDSPVSTVSEILAGWNPLNNPYPNETPAEKLRREAREADERYKAAVKKLDYMRCKLEEAVIDHLRFMERCELDRLKAIKSVVLDFSGAISNVIPGLKSIVDNMMLYQETIQPLGDLRYLLENYRTGGFVPRVQAYENYYGSVGSKIIHVFLGRTQLILLLAQTFGVDLEARARADRKRVPIVVTTILTFLDNRESLQIGFRL
jgi:Domain found in Dishevelled, Egl-10, and Pleckstrin (DEP)